VDRRLPLEKVLVIFDDFLCSKKKITASVIQRALMNGSHMGLTIVNVMSYVATIPAHIRNNAHHFLTFWNPCQESRWKMFQYYFGVFPGFKEFDGAFCDLTIDHGVMAVDCTGHRNLPHLCVSSYRADITAVNERAVGVAQVAASLDWLWGLKDETPAAAVSPEPAESAKSADVFMPMQDASSSAGMMMIEMLLIKILERLDLIEAYLNIPKEGAK